MPEFKCARCDAIFPSRSGLAAHEHRHQSVRYACSVCPLKFYFQRTLDEHFHRAHVSSQTTSLVHTNRHIAVRVYEAARVSTVRVSSAEQDVVSS